MNDTKFIFFDLETTGCSKSGSIFHNFHRIVQISAVCGDEHFDQLVDPQCHIPTESTAIHRVTNDMANRTNNFGTVFPLFRAFIKKRATRGTKIVLVAHNAFGFDKLILEKECARFDFRVPTNWYFYDSLVTYRNKYPELVSKKLGDIYKERFREDLDGAHNALMDCLALKRLFEHDIIQHYSPEQLLQSNQQLYLNDNEDVIKIRGIGQHTRTKIKKLFSTETPTVGMIRAMLIPNSNLSELELFIRTKLSCNKEQFVFSILCEIVQPPNPHVMFQGFPFIHHTFSSILTPETVYTLLNTYHIRSAEQMKRYYLFQLKEDVKDWDKFLGTIHANSFSIGMMLRSI